MTEDDIKQIMWYAWQEAITRGNSGCTPAETARWNRYWTAFRANNPQYFIEH